MFPSSYAVYRLKYESSQNKKIRVLPIKQGFNDIEHETDDVKNHYEFIKQVDAIYQDLIPWHLSKKYKIPQENIEFVKHVHAVYPEKIIEIFYPDQLKLF